MIDLISIRVTKEQFDRIPEEEKLLFVKSSLFADEINILLKLITFSNKNYKDNIYLAAQNNQTLFLIKLLAGKLREGWDMLDTDFWRSKLSLEYDKYLKPEGKDKLDRLKRYFQDRSDKNPISLIRKKYAFHYDSEYIREQLKNVSVDESLEIYLGKHPYDTFFCLSHLIINHSIFEKVAKGDPWKALNIIFKDIIDVAMLFIHVIFEILTIIRKKYPDVFTEAARERLDEVANVNDIFIPYFIEGELNPL